MTVVNGVTIEKSFDELIDVDEDNSEKSCIEYSDTENLNLLTKTFQKFIKMKGRVNDVNPVRNNPQNPQQRVFEFPKIPMYSNLG